MPRRCFGVIPASRRETAASSNDSELVLTHSRTESNRQGRNIQIYTKEIPKKDRFWNTILGFLHNERHSMVTRISKEVTHRVRHRDQDEQKEDGAMHWDAILPTLKRNSRVNWKRMSKNIDWIECLHRGSCKTRFEFCKDADGELVYIRAIQGHSGGTFIHPELMNYVPISHKWKQFICHMGRARDRYSIAEAGLVAGGKEGKEGRQTIFFTPLDPYHSDASKAETVTDLFKTEKSSLSKPLETRTRCFVLDFLVQST